MFELDNKYKHLPNILMQCMKCTENLNKLQLGKTSWLVPLHCKLFAVEMMCVCVLGGALVGYPSNSPEADLS